MELIQFDSGNEKLIKKFVDFEWELYKDDPNWVPTLRSDMKKTLRGTTNPLFKNGVHTFYIVTDGKKTIGRILVGIDEKLNSICDKKQGYFSLFECVNDKDAAFKLFDAAKKWLAEKGMDSMIGPVSPTNGDDKKGVLVLGYNERPVLMNSYNPEYYGEFCDGYGFEKDEDHVAFVCYPKNFNNIRYDNLVQSAMNRYGYRVDRLDLKFVDREVKDIHRILHEGMPEGWEYTTPASLEAIYDEVNNLKQFYNNRYCFIVRKGDRPLGFMIGLPDFNQVLARMRSGRLLPFGWLKYLIYKNKIDTIRVFVQFVVKDFQKHGVTGAMFNTMYKDVMETGITVAEASTIGEYNETSILTILKAGGKLYRKYRVYRLNF